MVVESDGHGGRQWFYRKLLVGDGYDGKLMPGWANFFPKAQMFLVFSTFCKKVLLFLLFQPFEVFNYTNFLGNRLK